MAGLKRYWVSWRSIVAPEQTPWVVWTTSRDDDGRSAYCAVIDAPSEMDARVETQRYFPDAEFRFSDEKATDFVPGDRFPPPPGSLFR